MLSPASLALIVLAAAFVFPFSLVVAVDADDKDIERLVKQLGSAKFKVREAATKRLMEIGEPARAALGKAAASSADLESNGVPLGLSRRSTQDLL